jgi:hypothetical protein
VKGPSGCAVRQSSKSSAAILQCVDGPVILELEANLFVDARATASERVESSSSDDDDDGDLDFSDNGDSSEAKLQSHQWQGAGEERWLGSGFYCERPAG